MPEVEETDPQPDLVWDDQVRSLCVRIYGDGSQSFLFVYRINDCQRFIRIGKTPVWSLEAARDRAKSLRSIVDQGATQRATIANAIIFRLSRTSSNTSPHHYAEFPAAITTGICQRGNGFNSQFASPLYPRKRTSLSAIAMSALCQKRTFRGAFSSALTLVFTNLQTL